MSATPESSEEIAAWLSGLRLERYAPDFLRAGYQRLRDLQGLTDAQLREIQVFPTGHRRRILRSLEAPRTWQGQPGGATELALSLSEWKDSTPHGLTQDFMVENEIYEWDVGGNCGGEPRPTRSYRLRHRPVPQIPDRTLTLLVDGGPQLRSGGVATPILESPHASLTYSKVLLPRAVSPVSLHEEASLYEDPSSALNLNAKESFQKEVNRNTEDKKLRGKGSKSQESDGYSELQTCVGPVGGAKEDTALEVAHCLPPLDQLPPQSHHEISPYACFYGSPKNVPKMGWLDKLSPQGNCVYQKRWVKFDGENLCYYNNDKEMYSKGLVLISAVTQVRGLGENKFEVVTAHRAFVFRVEKEGDRYEWINALQIGMRTISAISQAPSISSTNKSGYMELRGYKGKVFVSLMGTKVRLCKTEQDFKSGLGITIVELAAAHTKDVDRKCFEINTPFKTFCFTAESEKEKEEWIGAVQESIAETLSDYEVAEKIWFNESNRSCADCCAPQPEWASINLGVVICKKCAGQHKSLGSSISQVKSLKLDGTIWSNELIELFLSVGNKGANSFWAANLPPGEELLPEASPGQRAAFLRRKYKERRYSRVLTGFAHQEQLNKALCSAVVQSDVLETMTLLFSGADVMCATGDPTYSTPYLLAQRVGQHLQMEFLYRNKLSDFPKLDPMYEKRSPHEVSSFLHGFLYQAIGTAKPTGERKAREEMSRRWCTMEGGFLSYYENERTATPVGRMDMGEVASLAVSGAETVTGTGAVFTFETYLVSERIFMFGAETAEVHRSWVQAIIKSFIPPAMKDLSKRDYELIGRLHFKEGQDLGQWRTGWFALTGSTLHFHSGEGVTGAKHGRLNLRRLQELTVSTHTAGSEKMEVLLMVESGRTLYVRGLTRLDFSLWHNAIRRAAGTDGRALDSQQLSKNDVPIVLDSCIAFVTQYGLCYEGIYQKTGDPQRVAQLLEDFRRDARSVKLRNGEQRLVDVTDVLKAFLAGAEDALLVKELYPYWVSILDEEKGKKRVEKYSTLIHNLPRINRSTLGALIQHLYRVQKCSHINKMTALNLARVLSPCLFQTDGQAAQEVGVTEDLINNYVELFGVNEDQVKQMDVENSFITRWKDTMFSQAGDLIFEVYLERKEPDSCCLIKVSPTMRSEELAEAVLGMRKVVVDRGDSWTTFEAIENGELERPLHHKEKVLEQVLEWSTLEDPSSAFLVIKKYGGTQMAQIQQGCAQKVVKGEHLKFTDGSSKLLTGHRFQERYVVLRGATLSLYKDAKSAKAEREVLVKSVKCYQGLRKKMKPPTSWGFTVCTEKQQWHFCCEGRDAQEAWVTSILRVKHGGELWAGGTAHPSPEMKKVTRGGAIAAVSKSGGVAPSSEDTCRVVGSRPDQNWMATMVEGPQHRGAWPPPSTGRNRGKVVAGGTKSLPWRGVLGREPKMPPGLLVELNSVLKNSGRSLNKEYS